MALGSALIGGGLQILGGLLGNRSARRTGRTLNSIADAERQQFQDRAAMQGQGLRTIADRYRSAYDFRPVTSRNAFGSAGMDQYGNVSVNPSDSVMGWAGQYGTLADQEYGQLAGLDRQQMAADRIAQVNELLRPGDEYARTSSMDDLRRRGLMGFTKTDARTGGQANPYATSFASGLQTRGLQQAYDATDWVEGNIQNRLQNLMGLRQSQVGMLQLPESNLAPMQWGYNAQRNAATEAARYGYGADLAALNADLDAQFAPASYWENSRQAAGAAGIGRQGLISGVQRGLTGIAEGYFAPPPVRTVPAPIEQRTYPASPGYNPDVQVNPVRMPGMIYRRTLG